MKKIILIALTMLLTCVTYAYNTIDTIVEDSEKVIVEDCSCIKTVSVVNMDCVKSLPESKTFKPLTVKIDKVIYKEIYNLL